MSTRKRFATGFAATAIAAAFLNLLPYLQTRGAYNGDGFEVAGFPFTFRRLGGFAGIHEFRPAALFADIALSFTVVLFIGYICTRDRHRDGV